MVNSVVLAKVFKEISGSSVAADVAEPLAPAAGVAANELFPGLDGTQVEEGISAEPEEKK